jgi:hypothetical protein
MKLKKSMTVFIWLCCVAVSSSFAQKTAEKPYDKWSKEEAMRVLSDSSWAKTYQSTAGSASASAIQSAREQNQSVNSGGSNPRSVARNFGPPPVVLRLHSALPIRQALIRMQQLTAGYNKMDEKQKSQFDDSAKTFLACAICQNYYVVTLTQFPDPSGQSIEEGIFQRMALKDLKGNVWLENENGEKRELIQFTPPKGRGDSAVFFFARKDDKDSQFLTTQNKELKFVFKNDFLNSSNPYAGLVPRNFEFKVSKLMLNGNVEF